MKKEDVRHNPAILILLEYELLTLGKKAIPQKRPVRAPPT